MRFFFFAYTQLNVNKIIVAQLLDSVLKYIQNE